MILNLYKTVDIGDLGIIFLIHWIPMSNEEEVNSNKRYFCVYYSKRFKESADGFLEAIKGDNPTNGVVSEEFPLHVVLEDYVKDSLKENKNLYEEPEEAIFDVFKRLHSDKMLFNKER